MNPQIASLFCVFLIIYLFWLDRKEDLEGVSNSIWVPIAWMFFAGSRYLSQWVHLGAPVLQSPEAYIDGSPLDRGFHGPYRCRRGHTQQAKYRLEKVDCA